MSRHLALPAVALCAALTLSACASDQIAPGDAVEPPLPPAAEGTVTAQGTVLQLDGKEPRLCLGPVAESYPPQCDGVDLLGWDWSAVDGEEAASGVTWGAYAIDGDWDGIRFTATGTPIVLALYDPVPRDPDPRMEPANRGQLAESVVEETQERLNSIDGLDVLATWSDNGYVWVSVPYDDGTIQAYLDRVFGPDLVAVQSALASPSTS